MVNQARIMHSSAYTCVIELPTIHDNPTRVPLVSILNFRPSSRPPFTVMSSTEKLLADANSASKTDTKRAEDLYKQILVLPKPAASEGEDRLAQTLRDQETALVNLGQLYRDQKWVSCA